MQNAGGESSRTLDVALAKIREDFVRQMWVGTYWLVLVGAPISLARAFTSGWLPVYSVHACIALLTLLSVPMLKLSSFRVQALALVILPWMVGLPGAFTFGLVASGIIWLFSSCLVASIAFSVRAGLLVAFLTFLMMLLIGLGFTLKLLQAPVEMNAYMSEWSAWGNLIVSTGAYFFIVLRASGSYLLAIEGLTKQLDKQRGEIERLASHDALTGLLLMRAAQKRIETSFANALQNSSSVALLFIDLDRFKAINDAHGHDVGDLVLQQVADCITMAIRGQDYAVRVGGDEFLVVVDGQVDLNSASKLANDIIDALAIQNGLDASRQSTEISIGIALFPQHARNFQELRRMADQAMYRIKKNGGNGVALAA